MDYRPLPIGISDFADMISREFYYVDKTLMIRELLDSRYTPAPFRKDA